MSNHAPECLVVDGPYLGAKIQPLGYTMHLILYPGGFIPSQSMACQIADGDRAGKCVVINPKHIKPIAKREDRP